MAFDKARREARMRAPMNPLHVSLLGATSLAACGGGGSSPTVQDTEPRDDAPTVTLSGHVIKGPLSNALVFADLDGDGVRDPGEPFQRTDTDGAFLLSTSTREVAVVALTDTLTVDTLTETPLTGLALTAPAGSAVISPLTAMMAEANLSAAEVTAAFGLPAINPTTFNPFDSDDADAALAVEIAAHQLANALRAVSAAIRGSGASEAEANALALGAVGKSVADAARNGPIDLADAGFVQSAFTNAADELDGAARATVLALEQQGAAAVANVNAMTALVTDLSSGQSKAVFALGNALSAQLEAASAQGGDAAAIAFADKAALEEALAQMAEDNGLHLVILVLDEFGESTAARDNVHLFDYSAQYEPGWQSYPLDSLDQLGEIDLSSFDLRGFTAFSVIPDTVPGPRTTSAQMDEVLAMARLAEVIDGEAGVDFFDNDEEFDYVYDALVWDGSRYVTEYYYLNDLDGRDIVPWIDEAERSGVYISYFETFEDLDGSFDYFASQIPLLQANIDTDPELDYLIYDFQDAIDIVAGSESFSYIAPSDRVEWGLARFAGDLAHGDVVIGDIMASVPDALEDRITIVAVDILNDIPDEFGLSFSSGDTDYLFSPEGFADIAEKVLVHAGLRLEDIHLANMSLSGPDRGMAIAELAQHGILTFASLPNDGPYANRFWGDWLEGSVSSSSGIAVDVAGSEPDGVYPDAAAYADIFRTAQSDYAADWFGTSFATPEALGDLAAALLAKDSAELEVIFADGVISLGEALAILDPGQSFV